jgi:hypothetical protein
VTVQHTSASALLMGARAAIIKDTTGRTGVTVWHTGGHTPTVNIGNVVVHVNITLHTHHDSYIQGAAATVLAVNKL